MNIVDLFFSVVGPLITWMPPWLRVYAILFALFAPVWIFILYKRLWLQRALASVYASEVNELRSALREAETREEEASEEIKKYFALQDQYRALGRDNLEQCEMQMDLTKACRDFDAYTVELKEQLQEAGIEPRSNGPSIDHYPKLAEIYNEACGREVMQVFDRMVERSRKEADKWRAMPEAERRDMLIKKLLDEGDD